jgi:high-affinity nickel permease
LVEVASTLIWMVIGLVLGLEHSFDPDHVVAVSAILSNHKSVRKSLFLGSLWGLGHTIALFFAGIIILALSMVIPESVISLFELGAGIMLVILGILVLKPLITNRIYEKRHTDPTEILQPQTQNAFIGHGHEHKSLLAGILQGMGGSAAIMLVTLSTVNSITLGLAFILIFGIGVIIGMLSIGALIGSLLKFTALHFNKINEMIKAVTGSAAIIFGIYIILRIVLV